MAFPPPGQGFEHGQPWQRQIHQPAGHNKPRRGAMQAGMAAGCHGTLRRIHRCGQLIIGQSVMGPSRLMSGRMAVSWQGTAETAV